MHFELFYNTYFYITKKRITYVIRSEAEKVGFEPTAPFGVTGFQDQLLKPLGHLSKVVMSITLL